MDTVFIDTSVFISENFLEGNRIREIYKLAYDGHIQLVLPRITYNEILNRIAINTTEALTGYKAFREKVKIVRNIPGFDKKFEKIDTEKSIKELQKLFADRIRSIETIIIDYPTLDISAIFDKYFAGVAPFSSGEKKSEFPDAFALATLEKWCVEKGRKCILISGDKDLTGYVSKQLKVASSLSDYLDVKLRSVAVKLKRQRRLEIASRLYEEKKSVFQKEIEDWLLEELNDERTYSRIIFQEIHHIYVPETEANLGDFQVATVFDHNILLTAVAEISFEVELEIDDESSAWRDEDKDEWQYTRTKNEVIRKEKRIYIAFEVDIPLAGDDYINIKISEINKGKDLEM
jgi:predicted nucleic acid-binding protein